MSRSPAAGPSAAVPLLRQIVIDTEDARGLAEFYRELVGLSYRPGDEPPAPGQPDPRGADWLALRTPAGVRIAFQQVGSLPPVTWPDGPRPQMMHLDLMVPDAAALQVQRERALALGAVLLRDESDDPEEALYVLADPSGHPFCIFVADDAGRGELLDW